MQFKIKRSDKSCAYKYVEADGFALADGFFQFVDDTGVAVMTYAASSVQYIQLVTAETDEPAAAADTWDESRSSL